MKRSVRWAAAVFTAWLALLIAGQPVSAQDEPVVRAVLFYSPTCSHCHKVMTEDLPPLIERYGSKLQILTIDATQPDGQALYKAAIKQFAITDQRRGVPALFVGKRHLVGSTEIPDEFPGLIEYHLANGGIDWPDIPGLEKFIPRPAAENAAGAAPGQVGLLPAAAAPEQVSMIDRFNQDPAANSLAVLVLSGMIAALIVAGARLNRAARARASQSVEVWRKWVVTALCAAGLGIALYLAYVETTQTLAVCGPVGDCNTVQQSEYARLFGLIPIGVLGAAGYIAILAAWWLGPLASGDVRSWLALSVVAMALFGTLFSIYLTFLEPFVIGATCAWCLSSAVVMTAILLLVADAGGAAWAGLSPSRRRGETVKSS